MADYTKSKTYGTTNYPVHANGTSGLLRRVEPLINPKQLKSRYLKGILEIAARFGITWTDEELKDQINMAVNRVEIDVGVPVFGEQFREKLPFDQNLYMNFMHMRTDTGPISSIERLDIVSSNQQNIFTVPAEWIETAQFHQRQINVIPLLSNFGSDQANTPVASGGIAYLSIILGRLGWIPSYWQVIYTAGMCASPGEVPVVVNEAIGMSAALSILGLVAPNNINNSVALSQDGISQTSSTAGVQFLVTRIQELQTDRQALINKIKKVYSQKYFIGTL